jgi:hypothetical protein
MNDSGVGLSVLPSPSGRRAGDEGLDHRHIFLTSPL